MPRGDNFRGQKVGGRKAGSKNKNSLDLAVKFGDQMESAIERILGIANTSEDEEVAVRATNALMPYFYPKLSSVQIKQDPDQNISAIKVEIVKKATE